MAQGSLLDTVLDRLTAAGRSLQPLTRVCLIGRLAPGSSADAFGSWCEGLCKPASITGLLLALPNGWIQTVEGPTAALVPYLRELEGTDRLVSVKVVAAQEDVRGQLFPYFTVKSLSIMRSNFTEVDTDVSPLVADTAIGMLKIGKKLSAGEPASVIDQWETHFPDMPSNERVDQLLDMSELPPLEEYLTIFESPVDILMEGERVWPPERAQPY